MSKEEESVFETLNNTLADIDETLSVTNESLAVIATEIFEIKRSFIPLVGEIKSILAKLAEVKEEPWKEAAAAIKEPEGINKITFQSSALPKSEGETE